MSNVKKSLIISIVLMTIFIIIMSTNKMGIYITTYIVLFNFLSCIILLLFEEVRYIIRLGIKKLKIKNYFYRDELNEFSPFIKAKMFGRKLFSKDIIMAMEMYMQDKELSDDMPVHEKAFIENKDVIWDYLRYEPVDKGIEKYFEKTVIDDMKKANLINPSQDYVIENDALIADKDEVYTLIILFLNIIVLSDALQKIVNFDINYYLLFWPPLIAMGFIFTVNYISYRKNINLKKAFTEYGWEYYDKMISSRNFLKKFSVIKTRNIEEKIIWGSYITNSVIYDFKGELDKSVNENFKLIFIENDKAGYIGIIIGKILYYIGNIIGFMLCMGPWLFIFFRSLAPSIPSSQLGIVVLMHFIFPFLLVFPKIRITSKN